jgi:hypothetical protein
MLESYHDGTQEVVGTTYINDMNWDAGELTLDMTTGGSWAIDTVNGVLSVTTVNDRSGVSFRAVQIVDGYWRFRFNTTSNRFQFGILQQNQITDSSGTTSIHNGGGYIVDLNTTKSSVYTSATSYLGTSTVTYVAGTTYLCEVLKVGNVITLKLTDPNGAIQTVTWTDVSNLFTTSIGVCNFYQHYPATTAKIWDFVAIGFESTSTNGIAACIPPIGGGARYGEQEEVYFNIQNAVKHGEYAALLCAKSTTPSVIEMTTQNITDSTSIRPDRVISEEVATTENYNNHVVHTVTKYQDRNDIIEVSVKNKNASNICVETLAITPIYEVI